MLDGYEFDDIDEVSLDEAYYDDISGDLAFRWGDPLRPTGIGDDTDTWY